LAACSAPKLNGIKFDPPEKAPAMVLARADGSTFDLHAQHGRVVMLFFGYTHCPDVCPTTLADWQKIYTALGRDTSRVEFVFVSVDPERDTPEIAQAYVNNFNRAFIGLSGDSVQIARTLAQFHLTAERENVQSANGYAVRHSSQTFVIDPQGRLRLLYPFGISTDAIVSDLKQLAQI
jgi:protein SCO1/2